MKDKKLVECLNPTLNRRKTILFFSIVVINRLICIEENFELNTFRINSLFIGE